MVHIKSIRIDKEKARDGVWVEFVPGLEFRIARTGGGAYRAEIARAMAPFHKDGAVADPESAGLQRAMAETLAKHIVKDWRGLEDVGEDGTLVPVPYSVEKAAEILTDPAHEDLYEWVLVQASGAERYREGVQGN